MKNIFISLFIFSLTVLSTSFTPSIHNAETLVLTPQEDTKACQYSETSPVFPGGNDSMIKFILYHIRYPRKARLKGIEGRVMVSFVVEKDGSVQNVNSISKKPVDESLRAEAIRVVMLLPKFEKPGYQDGQPVRVKMAVPVIFKIDG